MIHSITNIKIITYIARSMKNLLFIVATILLDVASCGPRHHIDEPSYLSVSVEQVMLENRQGASDVIKVYSNSTWNIVTDGSWVEVQPVSGKGNGEIMVTALSSNEESSWRSCTMTISSEDITKQVRIYQGGDTADK